GLRVDALPSACSHVQTFDSVSALRMKLAVSAVQAFSVVSLTEGFEVPKYLCPTKTLPTRIPPTTTKKPTITVHPKPTKTATITIPRPRPTCGPCLNDCIVNCPDGALCK